MSEPKQAKPKPTESEAAVERYRRRGHPISACHQMAKEDRAAADAQPTSPVTIPEVIPEVSPDITLPKKKKTSSE